MHTCVVCLAPDETLLSAGETCAYCAQRIVQYPGYVQDIQACRTMESDLDYMLDHFEQHPSDELAEAIEDKYQELMALSLKLALLPERD